MSLNIMILHYYMQFHSHGAYCVKNGFFSKMKMSNICSKMKSFRHLASKVCLMCLKMSVEH